MTRFLGRNAFATEHHYDRLLYTCVYVYIYIYIRMYIYIYIYIRICIQITLDFYGSLYITTVNHYIYIYYYEC